MVVRLEGKVQGQDVIFNRVQGDEWETIIPSISEWSVYRRTDGL